MVKQIDKVTDFLIETLKEIPEAPCEEVGHRVVLLTHGYNQEHVRDILCL